MSNAYIIERKKLKQWLIVLLATFFCATFLFFQLNDTLTFSTPKGPKALYKVETEQNEVALTFNISWGNEEVIPIIEELQQLNIQKATFFLSGVWAERHPDIVRKIVEAGFDIGNLGYEYKSYADMEEDEMVRDLMKAHHILSDLTEQKIHLFRPPNGQFNEQVLRTVEKQGYSTIHFSIDVKDWTPISKEEMITRATKKTTKGDIVLLHASDSARKTAEILSPIHEDFKQKGLTYVTVDELITNAKSSNKEM